MIKKGKTKHVCWGNQNYTKEQKYVKLLLYAFYCAIFKMYFGIGDLALFSLRGEFNRHFGSEMQIKDGNCPLRRKFASTSFKYGLQQILMQKHRKWAESLNIQKCVYIRKWDIRRYQRPSLIVMLKPLIFLIRSQYLCEKDESRIISEECNFYQNFLRSVGN